MRVITDMIYKRTVKEFFQQHILGVALLNKNEILLTNDTFLDILNIETNGKAILSVDSLLDKISEDDRTFMQKLLENIDGGGIANQGSITVSIESKEGKKRIFAADYSIIVVDGEFLLSLILKDITSRQMEIRDLRQRAKMYAAVMENKNQSVLLVDRDYHVIDFNHLAYTKMIDKFGLVLEKDIYLFREFSSASASTLQSYLNDGFAGKELHIEEEFHEHEHSFWFEISVIPILNEQNQIDTVALLALDITGRKLTELALQQSEKRFRMVLENAGVGIVTVNNEGHILYANRQFCSIVNYNLFELQEMNVFDIAVPGDKSETMKNFKLLQQGLTSVVTREKLMKRKDGRQIWVNLTVTRFDHNDSIPDSFVGVAEDISRRKETEIELVKSEKRFRDVFENASIGIYRSTAEGKVLLANPALIKMLGYNSFDDLVTRNIETDGYYDRHKRKEFFAIMEKEGEVKGFETVWKKADGSPVAIIENARAIKDDRGNIVYYEGEAEDITERKRVTEKLQQSEQQYRALAAHLQSVRETERAAIAREIHDEFGQVLASLQMNINFLGKSIAEKNSIPKKEVLNELQAMSAIINTSVSTMKSLITELRPQILDNLGFIDAADNLLQEFKKRSGLQTTFFSNIEIVNLPKSSQITLYRIVQEALNNIKKHSHASAVSLLIRQRDDKIVITIKDNGKGFDPNSVNTLRSFGILGMRERAYIEGWEIDIQTSKQHGTSINVTISQHGGKSTKPEPEEE